MKTMVKCLASVMIVVMLGSAPRAGADISVPFDSTVGWVTVPDSDLGGASHAVVSDPENAANDVGSFAFPNSQIGFRLYDLGAGIANGTSDFIEFQFYIQSDDADTSDADFWFGFTDLAAGANWANSFANMEAYFGIREDTLGDNVYDVQSRNGGASTVYDRQVTGNSWNTMRIDVDNTADTYDLTLNGSALAAGLTFRNSGSGPQANDLISFAVFANNNLSPANPVLADQTVVPEPGTLGIVLLGGGLVAAARRRQARLA